MSSADDFDRTAAQVDLQLWDAEMLFGACDPLKVLRRVIRDPVDEADRIMRIEAILRELGWPESPSLY